MAASNSAKRLLTNHITSTQNTTMSYAKSYEIRFRLKQGNDPAQTAIIQASDSTVARKIFEQSNPGARVIEVREV